MQEQLGYATLMIETVRLGTTNSLELMNVLGAADWLGGINVEVEEQQC